MFNLTMKHQWTYIFLTLLIYFLDVLGGMFIPNVDIIFNFAASISGTALMFIFPAGFFLSLEKKNKSSFIGSQTKLKWMRISCYAFIVVGLGAGVTLLVNDFLGIFDPVE